ncbi:hypothetical protein [Pectinatus frisingensis]|uniref:hypothetical protein n=1 Tax=Pectinatus frisingensis TaxID=865 RepID=UPI0018C49515|nr:hypothetical protein [Pectinatus frisingensis]
MKIVDMMKIIAGVFLVSIVSGMALPTQALAYTYVSKEYGYSIECPEKPLGVIPLVDPEQKGEVLVFKNEGYNILKGWIIATNAFDSNQVPDFDKMTAEDSQKYAAGLIENRGYQTALFIPLHGHKVLYAVGAPDVYVDSNKNDKADIKQQTSQRIETYIPGKKTNYVIVFFQSGEMSKQDITDYQNGLLSFKETADVKAVTDADK